MIFLDHFVIFLLGLMIINRIHPYKKILINIEIFAENGIYCTRLIVFLKAVSIVKIVFNH